MNSGRILLPFVLALAGSTAAHAQVLTLGAALDRAAGEGYANRAARAQADAAQGEAGLTLRGILPTVKVEGGYVRTTDPLGAFGAILRQRAVTPAAFDPAQLNDPAAIGDVSSALVAEQPIFNADALYGRNAAVKAGAAARASADWVANGTALDVVRAYYGAVLAAEQSATLDSAARAAHAHQRMAESLHRNGVATRSDALLAAVRAGEVDARLIAARGAARIARRRLALVLGAPADTGFTLPDHLPDTTAILRLAVAPDSSGAAPRSDVRAARLALEAASAGLHRATAALLPRVNAFGRLDWNAPSTPFGGRDAWTVGVMVSWSPFSGGTELAQRRVAAAQREAARVGLEAATAQALLDTEEAANALEVAEARMSIAGAAVGQSGEAHRIVARKYEGGLATAVELFDAAAEETATRLSYADARYQAIVALAQTRRAAGRSLAPLTSLDSTEQ